MWDIYKLGIEHQIMDSVTTGDDWEYSKPLPLHRYQCMCVLFIIENTGEFDVDWLIQGSPRHSDIWGDCNGRRRVNGGDVDKDICEKPYHRVRIAYKNHRKGKNGEISVWVLGG